MMNTSVLVVDDSATIRQLIGIALREAGLDVVEANDGVEGIEKIRAGGIDCVICDHNLPRKCGLQLLEEIKQDAEFASIPIVMLSNEGAEELVGQAKAAGAAAWIVKPCDPPMIVDAVKKLLQETVA